MKGKLLQRTIPALDGIRIFAAISVVAFHESVSVFKGGFLGVDIFFVLSGMLTASILLRARDRMSFGRVIEFIKRRFWRLWPLMACVVATVFVLLWALPGQIVRPELSALFFLANFQTTHIEGFYWFRHFWSLATEMQFYVILGVLFWLASGSSIRVLQLLLLAGFVIGTGCRLAFLWADMNMHMIYYHPLTHSSGLFVGAMLATVRWNFGRLNSAVALLAVAAIAICLHSAIFMSATMFFWFTAMEIAAAFLILSLVNSGDGPVAWFLSLPLIRQLGVWSYGVYLWHFPIALLTPASWGAMPSFAVTLTASIALSAISFFLVEDRFRHLGRRTVPA